MARKRIQGITIEIDGETKGLDKALKDVNKRSTDLAGELREVEKALKFNPGNTELLAQQQRLLQDQVDNSTKKLDQLKEAQKQVEDQFSKGKIGQAEYDAFRREIIKTESQIDGFKKKLDTVDDTKAPENLKKDFKEIGDSADKASEKVSGIGSALGGVAAGAGAAGAIDQALDFSALDTQIDISFNVPEESKKSVKDAVKDVTEYGVDAEEALEGVRRQWALNADASDAANADIVKNAGVISKAYAGIDFTELIQETNEIASELNMSNEEALGLTNSLLKMGFPPEQIDIIAEYGKQLSDAGYDAEEVQSIMQAGVETGTWNIDNLLDGLKEGRILVGEFGTEVDDATKDILKGTDISADQLQEWGKAVAGGGEKGKAAMQEVASALDGVKDATKKNELGVKIFGTLYEDQGQNIIDTLLNAEDQIVSTKDNQEALNNAASELDNSPAVKMKDAMNDIKAALAPLLEDIADFVSQIADWAKENSQLVSTLTVIATISGIVGGALIALAPIIFSVVNIFNLLKTVLPIIGAAFGAISAPVWIVIGVITALIGIITLLWTNWDTVSQWLAASWEWIKETAVIVFNAIGTGISVAWEWIKNATTTVWETIKTGLSVTWEWIKTTATTVFTWIKDGITAVWNGIKTVTTTVWNGIKGFISGLWNGIKDTASSVFNGIKDAIGNVWDGIKNTTSSMWNGIKDTITGIWDGLKDTASSAFNGIKDTISGVWDGVKGSTDKIWGGITDSVKGAINGVIGAINGMIGALNGLDINLPKIPDWVPGLGGKGGGSIGFPDIPKIPKLDVGTNYVKRDGLAMIHEGEAVVPKKYNPAAGGVGGTGVQINIENLAVREEEDIQRIAEELHNLAKREARGQGEVY